MTINHSKSIERGRIYANTTQWTDILEIIVFYISHLIFLVLLLVFPAYMLLRNYLDNNIDAFSIIFGVVPIALGTYLTFCLFNLKRLTKIEGINLEANKEIVIPIINAHYPELNYEWDQDILIGSRSYSDFNFKGGLSVVLIFDKRNFYLNILSIYKAGPNPWMAFTNIERAKEIGRIFKERIKDASNDRQIMEK